MKVYLAGFESFPYLLDKYDVKYVLTSILLTQPDLVGKYMNRKGYLLDSGAFSYMNQKNKIKSQNINWDEYVRKYADFINRYGVKNYFELDIDHIVGLDKVEYYRDFLEKETGIKPIPVWHINRGKQYFIDMCKAYPYVAIGGLVKTSINHIRPSEEQYRWFINTAHLNKAKIHALGMTSTLLLNQNRFDSVDSTSWLSGNKFAMKMIFDGKNIIAIACDKDKKMVDRGYRILMEYNLKSWMQFIDYAEKNL